METILVTIFAIAIGIIIGIALLCWAFQDGICARSGRRFGAILFWVTLLAVMINHIYPADMGAIDTQCKCNTQIEQAVQETDVD